MATSPVERQQILSDLATLGIRDLVEVWRKASLTDTDFAALIMAAFPEIASGYAGVAGDLAANWYVEAAPDLPYTPTTAPLPDVTALTKSTQWALGANGEEALNRMSGTLQRAVFDGSRDTIIHNVESEPGSKWVRYASPNACAFCAVMATRQPVYNSAHSATRVVGRGKSFATNFNPDGSRKTGGQAKGVKLRGTQQLGEKYHDFCHCVAVEVRPGGTYDPPDHIKQWQQAYQDAFAAVPDGTPYDNKNSILKAVLSNMRSDLGSH